MHTACYNKTKCTVNIDNIYKAFSPANLVAKNGHCGENSYVYIQYPCLIPDWQGSERKIFGLISGCLVVFVYLFVVIFFDYIKCV